MVLATCFCASTGLWTWGELHHAVEQESMCGSIWAFEHSLHDSRSKQPCIPLSKGNLLFIYLTILLTSSSRDKFWLMTISSSLFEDTFSRVLWCSGKEALFCQVAMSITFVLAVFAAMWFSEHHFDTFCQMLFYFWNSTGRNGYWWNICIHVSITSPETCLHPGMVRSASYPLMQILFPHNIEINYID